MAHWITFGSRAYNLDSIAYVQAAAGGVYDIFGSGGIKLPVPDADKAAIIDALVAQGMTRPAPSLTTSARKREHERPQRGATLG